MCYIPKPGDLIFAPWVGVDEHSCEVIEFLGSTARGTFTAANFWDRSIIYTFNLHPVYGDVLKHFCKFGIHRKKKTLKPKFSVGEMVEVDIANYRFNKEPVLCQITHVKLKYDPGNHKCRVGYKFKIMHEDKYDPKTLNNLKSVIHYVKESNIRKFVNYNSIWESFCENTENK